MKWLSFLKSKSGKLVMNAQNVLITSAAIGVGATTLFYNVGINQSKKELAVRSVTSISDPFTYEGMQRSHRGLTSINVQDSRHQIANQDDLERMGNRSASSNNFGLDNIDRLEGRLTGGRLGAAAATGESDGLGLGSNKATLVDSGVDYSPQVAASERASSAARLTTDAVAGQASGSGGPAKTKGAGGQLPSASMARASGNAFGAAAGSMGGNSRSAGGRNGGSSNGSNYNFTGLMAGSSSAVPALRGDGGRGRSANGPSTFMARGRQGTSSAGRRTPGKGDLPDIAKRSADAAANSHKSAMEGMYAFLGSSRNSGGMTIENGVEVGTTSSADFKTPTTNNLKKLQAFKENIDEDADKRQEKSDDLGKWLLITLASMVAGAIAGYALITAGKAKPGPWGIVMIVAGFAVLAAAAAVATTLIVKAAKFANEFSGTAMSTISCIVGGLAIAALAFVGISAMLNKASGLGKWMAKIMPKVNKLALKGAKAAAAGAATSAVKSAVSGGGSSTSSTTTKKK